MNYNSKNYPSEMTNEIAFRLGQEDFPRFYDIATWTPNTEEFELCNFFKWEIGFMTSQNNIRQQTFSGYLDEEKFTALEFKLAYLRGRLKSYSVIIEKARIHIDYANSYNSRDRFAKWAEEIIVTKYGRLAKLFTIITGERFGVCPGAPFITIIGDEDIIKLITG